MPTIVIGVDLSPSSRRAFDAGTHLARDLGAALVVVHGLQSRQVGLGAAGATQGVEESMVLEDEEAARVLSTEWLEHARRQGVRAEVEATATHDPAKLILHAARQHDAVMVVVGTHGRRGLSRVLMGSVAEAVVRGADRPVLVVPSE